MFAGSNQIQILSFNFVHHRIHLSKAHYAGNHIAADHERRHAIGKPSVNHKISGIGNNCRMDTGNIAHQIIETIASYFSCTVQIKSIKAFHDLCVIRNFKIRHYRFSIALYFHIFAVIFSNRNGCIDNIGNYHHILFDFLFYFFFSCRKFFDSCTGCSYLFFNFLCFISFSLCHQSTNLFGNFIFIRT